MRGELLKKERARTTAAREPLLVHSHSMVAGGLLLTS